MQITTSRHEFFAQAANHHGLMTFGMAHEAGLSATQIRTLLGNGVIERRSRVVLRVAGAPRTWHQRVLHS